MLTGQSKFEFFASMLTEGQVKQMELVREYFDSAQGSAVEKVSEAVQNLNNGSLRNEK